MNNVITGNKILKNQVFSMTYNNANANSRFIAFLDFWQPTNTKIY